jgi:DNA-binding SARP family transcriptional activator
MKHLALSFFGTFQVTVGGQPVTQFRSVKSQGLLIYLVLTPQQTHARDVLATLFWPD